MLLNYPWREEHLERSAAAAGPARARDVYAGVDVFGRGSYGGGGFGAAEALRAARRLGLSAALFAPGWTHEALGGGAHFACNEHLFWARLRPHLHVRGPARLPLRTSFCQ
ncbi:Cytosolic endo-beta-N-acetylglucosaminidase, partial [Gryllus bimaculatus]